MNEQTYTRVNESTFPEKRLEGNKELNLDEQQKKSAVSTFKKYPFCYLNI